MHIHIHRRYNKIAIYMLFCKVDGGWSDWLIGNCSALCFKEKTRNCNNPEPSCGGKNCSGSAVENMKCNEFPCEGLLYTCIKCLLLSSFNVEQSWNYFT